MTRFGLLVASVFVVAGCVSPAQRLAAESKPGAATSRPDGRRATPVAALTKTTQRSSDRQDSSYVAALKATLGNDSQLSLVPSLQAAVEDALLASATAGAVVALDPNDGRVLALFSVSGDRGDPLLTPQHPASTFKSFTALAALRAGIITADTVFTCTGRYNFAGVQLTCPGQHGPQNVAHALATSCNAFFYEVGAKLDPAELAKIAREFGFAGRTGIELADTAGIVPDPPAKIAKKTTRPLVDAIGHGDYRVTLLALARAYAAIANGGNLVELHLVHGQRGADGTLTPVRHPAPTKLSIHPAALALVRSGLVDAVAAQYGRAHSVAIEGYPFAGKTGSADSPPPADSAAAPAATSEEQDSWFIAYAPPAAPKLLIAARLERVTHGNSATKLVARVLATLGPQ